MGDLFHFPDRINKPKLVREPESLDNSGGNVVNIETKKNLTPNQVEDRIIAGKVFAEDESTKKKKKAYEDIPTKEFDSFLGFCLLEGKGNKVFAMFKEGESTYALPKGECFKRKAHLKSRNIASKVIDKALNSRWPEKQEIFSLIRRNPFNFIIIEETDRLEK
ncbi:MAG: hypothetical protein WC705_02770 [Candidatus Paceibacterota bacterium]|jgi:hypothetical protein